MFPTCRIRTRFRYLNYFLFLFILFITICLIKNHRLNTEDYNSMELPNENNIESIIDRIQDIPILNQKFVFNITHQITINDIPTWINRYRIAHLFDLYWLQTGGYKWHLQQMMNLQHLSSNKRTNPTHNYNLSYLYDHPEYGVIIDTAPDPFQSIFSPLPRTGSSLKETCTHLELSNTWYPCYTRPKMMPFTSPITYALYDVTIDSSSSSSIESIHYDELIYLFDNTSEIIDENFFITQTLPRLIRLLALVPKTALILLPCLNSKMKFINQYLEILIQRGLLKDRKRFIKYQTKKSYHAHAVYSTSSPRSDLILLHHILIGNQPPKRRELILIIRNNLDDNNYNKILQTINQFELPENFEYLHIHEYTEKSYNIKEISQIFPQALIIIGMSSHILSHIVWCLPGTHIIEIGQKTMTTTYYDITLQLKLNYWLGLTTKNTRIDINDFRNLIMKVFTYIDT